MALEHLRQDARRLFDWFSEQAEARNFILIGGTAMAIHVGHRQSEDLDLVYTDGLLPPGLIRRILDKAAMAGFEVADGGDDLQRQMAVNAGRDPDYDHQDWFIGGVKFTFILTGATPSMEAAVEPPHALFNQLRVANLEALFRSKARLLLSRQTSRDLFDIWYFLDRQGKAIDLVADEMAAINKYATAEQNLSWIKNAERHSADPGFLSLLEDGPKSFEETQNLLMAMIDEYERRKAAELIQNARQF